MQSNSPSDESVYDYVIIGSGFGGSVAAMRLAEKGYRALILERGRAYSGLARSLPKLLSIVRDAEPVVALTSSAILPMGQQLAASAPALAAIRWVATDQISDTDALAWREPELSSQTVAFLQYTSGSTSSPKGVVVSHGNLLHNEEMIGRALDIDEQSVMVSWLPLYHDMGLIGNVIQALFTGIPCILMSPMSFLQRPLRWLQAVTRYRATVSGGPNFAYDLCARKVTPEQRAALDLSSWRTAFNGAEPIHAHTLRRFAEAFAPCGFRYGALYPCYGLAEATLFVTGANPGCSPVTQHVDTLALEQNQITICDPSAGSAHPLVGCGHPHAEQTVAVVDPETRTRLPDGQVGEIWAAGPSMAQGYWGKAAESAETFQARLADTGEGPFLRTGDLGFVHAGELFVTGRRKDLLIINGRNHYPQDIELTVEQAHPAIRPGCCAAFTVTSDEQERLVVVAEVDRHYRRAGGQAPAESALGIRIDPEVIIQAVRREVSAQHDLQVHAVSLIRTGGVLKTSSGKIQRFACRAGFLAGTLEPWS